MIYADVQLEPSAALPFDPDYEERGLYTMAGTIRIAGDRLGPGRLRIFKPGDRIAIRAESAARFMILDGAPMDGPRHIRWNCVSSRKDRNEQAKADWSFGRFSSAPGETEFIPLPGRENTA